jgi:hypothetical protein
MTSNQTRCAACGKTEPEHRIPPHECSGFFAPSAGEQDRKAGEKPCEYCGTTLVGGDTEAATAQYHFVSVCREYTAAAMRSYRAEVEKLTKERDAAREAAKLVGWNRDNGRTITCLKCKETAFGVCTHIADRDLLLEGEVEKLRAERDELAAEMNDFDERLTKSVREVEKLRAELAESRRMFELHRISVAASARSDDEEIALVSAHTPMGRSMRDEVEKLRAELAAIDTAAGAYGLFEPRTPEEDDLQQETALRRLHDAIRAAHTSQRLWTNREEKSR